MLQYKEVFAFNVYMIFQFTISFPVGITWEDAPEDQYAVIHKDSKIRCVVKARPAATVDWLKESLIISTGQFLSKSIFKQVSLVKKAFYEKN